MNRSRILPFFIALSCLPLAVETEAKPAPKPSVGPIIGGPTLITFSGQNVPLSTIERIFSDASGLPTKGKSTKRYGDINDIKGKAISVDWNGTPFWQAAREVELKSGLQWSILQPGRMALETRSPENPHPPTRLLGTVVAQSPYALVVANPKEQRDDYSSITLPGYSRLTLTVFIDPATADVSPLFDKVDFIANGTPLARQPVSTSSSHLVGGIGERIKTIVTAVKLSTPPGAAVQANGVLDMTLPAATQLWTVPDLLNAGPLTQVAGKRKYIFESAQVTADKIVPGQPTGDGEKLVLHFSLATSDTVAPDEDSSSYFKSLAIFDKKGRPLAFRESTLKGPMAQPDGSTRWEYEVTFRNPMASQPIREPLRMELAMAVNPQKEVELPFEKVDLDVLP